MPRDPYVAAWTDQFGALLRDKCLQMLRAVEVTDWDSVQHSFKDPYDDDLWLLSYNEGEIALKNMSDPGAAVVFVDLERLGITP